jgi:hypothetical protein
MIPHDDEIMKKDKKGKKRRKKRERIRDREHIMKTFLV